MILAPYLLIHPFNPDACMNENLTFKYLYNCLVVCNGFKECSGDFSNT